MVVIGFSMSLLPTGEEGGGRSTFSRRKVVAEREALERYCIVTFFRELVFARFSDSCGSERSAAVAMCMYDHEAYIYS